jgi:hypothetical protein
VHQRLGTAGLVVAIVALVAALAGGAYAASGGLTGKQKKEVKAIAKGFQGTGPAGLQGPPGAAGKSGADGEKGAPGSNGKSVVVENENTGTANCAGRGGSSFHEEGSATKHFACNGQTGFTKTLPSHATETGPWTFGPFEDVSAYPGENRSVLVPLDFPIPLEAELASTTVHLILENGEELNSTFEEEPSTACKGTAVAPSAEPGNLCIYASTEILSPLTLNAKVIINPEGGSYLNPATGAQGASTAGMGLEIFVREEDGAKAFGTWAVTAE